MTGPAPILGWVLIALLLLGIYIGFARAVGSRTAVLMALSHLAVLAVAVLAAHLILGGPA
ncbi:hypothetical protein CHO01_25370 [Cellulomonas hominis]|uniref:Uncharacterized protein n=1 Tax=Cellulomonas hominis TaxID=156981 RepID=A0A511FDX0_9CELL|nr:hypothetical protein [Cellulomonas hominis]MBB5472504.1 hypothetical protein [Cellulomonas hominis]NKY05874.1 hypothetical protein [Cellulomonas hominis]GEL47421.1 hypothetical protein CHO01_25370 [Cellulomonas hominis]